jgi:hypothetical protein
LALLPQSGWIAAPRKKRGARNDSEKFRYCLNIPAISAYDDHACAIMRMQKLINSIKLYWRTLL